ncbi:hypothetical protein HXZ66_01885 [Bacillus sp. A116_S68]|nr:hypothetical protein HXZ66_01885 [Bacillus sp. A116_S68]
MVEEHQRVIKAWDEHVEEVNQMRNNVNNYIERRDMQKIDNEQEKEREEKKKVLEFWNGMAQADYDAKRNFQTASEGFITIFSKLDTLAREIGKTNGSIHSLVETLQVLISEDNELTGILFYKLDNDMLLTNGEREVLFSYLQNEVVDDEFIIEMEEIIGFMESGNDEALMDRLNNQVFLSDSTLDLEISNVQIYLFVKNMRREDLEDVDEVKLEILNTYLATLINSKYYTEERKDKTFKSDLKEINVNVYNLKYDRSEKNPNAHILTVNLESEGGFIDEITSVYYAGTVPIANSKEEQIINMKEELTKYDENYNYGQIKGGLISKMGSSKNPYIKIAGEVAKRIDDRYNKIIGKSELKNNLTLTEVQQIADVLDTQLIVTERSRSLSLYAQIIPTNESYRKIGRWEEAYNLNSNVPFPKESVNTLDWEDIANSYREDEHDIDDAFNGLPDYIKYDYLGDRKLEDVVRD